MAIQEVFNGMVTLMLAKFILNDMPHTLDAPTSSNPNAKEYRITDSRGILHTFILRWRESTGMHYSLDSKAVYVDDRYGWAYGPEYKPVRDKVLRDEMDKIVFGEVMPTGEDQEE